MPILLSLMGLLKNPLAVKGLLIAGAVAFLLVYGYHWGAGNVQAEWDASAARQRDLVQVEKDKLQARANETSKAYQDYKKRTTHRLNATKQELAHEIAKTPSLLNCVASSGFVSLLANTNVSIPADSR